MNPGFDRVLTCIDQDDHALMDRRPRVGAPCSRNDEWSLIVTDLDKVLGDWSDVAAVALWHRHDVDTSASFSQPLGGVPATLLA